MDVITPKTTFEALDLRKQNVINLTKELGIHGIEAQVVFALDYSGSMDQQYRNGSVQAILERIMPVALAMDANQSMDMYLFSTSYDKLPDATLSNIRSYVDNKITGKYDMGATNYYPVLNAIAKQYGITPGSTAPLKAGGFMSKLFKKLSDTVQDEHSNDLKFDYPVLVIFITDGDNSDHMESEQFIKDMSKYGFFFQFIGIGGASFNFLKRLDTMPGRVIDNANFFDTNKIESMSDTVLYEKMLTEFSQWVPQARTKLLIS